jgi:nucleoside-diphosphate-sugar epimerase
MIRFQNQHHHHHCCYGIIQQLLAIVAVSYALATGHQNPPRNKISIVTGANGYIGREVVNVLLKEKVDNIATSTILCLVRPVRVAEETKFWNRFIQKQQDASTSSTIQVLPYDMIDGGQSISDALQLALDTTSDNDNDDSEICVYHIASVFGPSEDFIQTANDNVQGTRDLIQAMANVSSRESKCRLVLTSSMAAVRGTGQVPRNGKFYTNQDWNTMSKLDETNWGSCYQWSKAESERMAWELAKKLQLPMTSICPSFVFGPPTAGASSSNPNDVALSNSYSITLVGQWVQGKSPVQSRLCVDIRDVAQALVAAGNTKEAIGERFIVSPETRVPSQVIAEALAKVCRETKLGDPHAIYFDSNFQGGAISIGAREVEATKRLENILGVTLRPVEET